MVAAVVRGHRLPHWYHNPTARNHPWANRPTGALSWRAERGRSFFILSRQWCTETVDTMPSLFRFLLVLCMLAGLTYGAMYALVHWYDPKPREITVTIPPDKFMKQQ
jgi:hypothetical protein